MKFLHLSDLHLGKRVYGYSMLEDQRAILEQIVRLAKEQQVDAFLIGRALMEADDPRALAAHWKTL